VTDHDSPDVAAHEPVSAGAAFRNVVSSLASNVQLLAAAGFTMVLMVFQPGELIPDTKLDLSVSPKRFIERSFHLWEPLSQLGFVQNQAVGYLFPMGAFFAGGSGLGVPAWLVQRAWLAVLLVVAMFGMSRLARELGIGNRWSRAAAGLCYAAAPTMLTSLGTVSGAVVGAAFAPWVVIPLVGVHSGRPVRVAAARSGLAVACIGGINATVTLGALVAAGLFVLVEFRGALRRRLALWWALCVGLASSLWMIPLVFQARFGFNFLPFTERADTTTSTTSAVDVLRGTSNWLAYLGFDEPWTRSGSMLVRSWPVALAAGLIAVAGLVGLTVPNLPRRRWLAWSCLPTLVLLCAGYAGSGGSVISGPARDALNGPLGFARNVARFDPSLRLALMLGFAHLLAWAAAAISAARWPRIRRPAQAVGLALAITAVAGALAPLWTGKFVPRGSFSAIPDEWSEVVEFLDQQGGRGRALVVPTSAFAEYDWGRPIDEPLQFLGDTRWASRSLIPLGGSESVALLDSIEDVLERGITVSGLPETMRRSGISYLVVRNDVDWKASGAPRPSTVRQSLYSSGFSPIQSFGEQVEFVDDPLQLVDQGLRAVESKLAPLEVWSSTRQTQAVSTYASSSNVFVAGGSDAVLPLSTRSLIDGRATRSLDEATADEINKSAVIITDAQRREAVEFGLVRNHRSYTLADGEVPPDTDEFRRFGAQTNRWDTVAEQHGVKSITSSSYGSWLLELPEVAPSAAFDGNPKTAWVSADYGDDERWLEVTFDEPTNVESLAVTPLADGPWRPVIGSIVVTNEAGDTVRTTIDENESAQRLDVPPGPTGRLRLTLEITRGPAGVLRPGPGLREVEIEQSPAGTPKNGSPDIGVLDTSRPLRVPALDEGVDPAGLAYAFDRSVVNPSDRLRRDGEDHLDRVFTTPRAASYIPSFTALAQPTDAVRDLWLADDPIEADITASSSWGGQLWSDIRNAFDTDPTTAWIPEPPAPPTFDVTDLAVPDRMLAGGTSVTSPVPAGFDPNPTITISWPSAQRLERLDMLAISENFSAPTTVRLVSKDGNRDVDLVSGSGSFEPLVTDEVTIEIVGDSGATTNEPITEQQIEVPIGVAEIIFVGVDTNVPGPRLDDVFETSCGEGPPITIDDTTYETKVAGTWRSLLRNETLPVTLCDAAAVDLPAGEHRLTSPADEPFVLTSATMATGTFANPSEARIATIDEWGPERRSVRVDAGPETVLVVHENASDGWTATLDGEPLRRVTIDGWQQGYVVPEGAAGMVQLTFGPQRWYRPLLAGSLLCQVVLVALAFFGRRRRAAPAAVIGHHRPEWLGLVVVGALFAVGPVAAAAGAAGWLFGRTRWADRVGWQPVLALAAAAIALSAIGVADSTPSLGRASFGMMPQLLCSAAIGLAVGLAFRATPVPDFEQAPDSALGAQP
jgi:arabinofuranan 3-O-arabinosyltransferase